MATSATPLRIVQISDTHIVERPGSQRFMGRDSDTTLRQVLDDIAADGGPVDAIVATGDLADRGHPAAYTRLRQMLSETGVPAYCLAGNHDRQVPFEAFLPGPGVHVERATRLGNWLFVFLDSNADGRARGDDGAWRDLPDRFLKASQGALTPEDAAWVADLLGQTDADNVMLWVHHPPRYQGHSDAASSWNRTVGDLIEAFPAIKGVAVGHIHWGYDLPLTGGPRVYACPSTAASVNHAEHYVSAPGYRRFEFHADGRIDSTVHYLDHHEYAERRHFSSMAELLEDQLDETELAGLNKMMGESA